MTPISELIEMQQGTRKRPLSCRFGLHHFQRVRWLITTGNALCVKCGAVEMLSLFGEFSCTRRESVQFLREYETKMQEAA